MAASDASNEQVPVEAAVFARYLVGGEPARELLVRYGAACRARLPGAPERRDSLVLEFIHGNSWALGPLDAACGLLRPRCALRQRLLIMAAVLEATPVYADEFLPRHETAGGLALVLAWVGLTTVFKTVVGVPLLLIIEAGA